MNALWPHERARALTEKFAAMDSKPVVRWTWLPSDETTFIRYFPDNIAEDLRGFPGLEYVEHRPGMDLRDVDIALRISHGGDLSGEIFELKARFPHLILATWMWDNHCDYANNLKTAIAADINFPSHQYAAGYLINPSAPIGAHVPLCCAQWSLREAAEAIAAGGAAVRSDKMLVNYVDYPRLWRSAILRELKDHVPEAQTLLMSPDDRSRYFSMSRSDRFKEWLGYKSALMLPVGRDLSTRLFDALLAGMVVVVPDRIDDLDAVVSPADQQRLGVVKLIDFDRASLREAAVKAARVFDEMGQGGVRARQQYVMSGHMLSHRLALILSVLRPVGGARQAVHFAIRPNGVTGLLWGPAR